MRPSRQQMFMRIAHVVAERSTCARLNVGAIITLDNRIVSMGWNGQEPGADHCVGSQCRGFHRPGSCGTIHAEENAIRYLPRFGSKSWASGPLDMYVTDSPCLDCMTKIVDAGINRLFFAHEYRDTSPLIHLRENGILIYQVMPAGFVRNWVTGQTE